MNQEIVMIENIIKYTSKLKLLYVEDNIDARESTLSILNEFFEDIQVACNGEEGLMVFQNNSIDLIITDINMPKINGLEMIERIRKVNKDLPILVLSAYNESGYFMDSIKLGVEGYLLKPIEMNQFTHLLNKLITKMVLENTVEENVHLLKQYQEVTDSTSIVSKTDLTGTISYVNDEFCSASGYTREELIGANHNIVRHPQESSHIYMDIWDTIKNQKKMWQGILRNISKNQNNYYVKSIIKPILDVHGEIIEYISLQDNITDIINPKKQLQDLSDTFNESLVLLLKIDGFEDIEQFYGSQRSENIEKKFSNIILELMPKECNFDKVFTLGNGEYGFVKEHQDSISNTTKSISNFKKLQDNVSDTNLNIGDMEYSISAIISFAYGQNSLENANYGLKKILKENQDFILANDLIEQEQAQAQKNIETIKMVKEALASHQIISHFQPIINNKTQKVEKYESLVRLVTPQGKVLSPYFFLDVAKKGKYYSQITSMVLDNSFHALQDTDMDISINISILDIEKKATREKIFTLLNEHKEQLHRVVFELLEDENVKDFKAIKSFILSVKEMGVKIAIDDFGAGYSNFERLLDYQPDILKIDGCLIKNIEHDSFSLNVVETIVNFAKKQNIKTIAEYVENENIFNILNKLDVDYSQGYYFGKPQALKSK